MATVTAKKTSKPGAMVPPEERFWKRYSAHHELPLAGMTSLFVHGLVLAFLFLGGVAFLFRARDEAARPPSIDVVMLGGGDNLAEGESGIPGAPGVPGTEAAVPQQQDRVSESTALPKLPEIEFAPLAAPDLPTVAPTTTSAAPDDVETILENVKKAAEAPLTPAATPAPPRPAGAKTAGAKPGQGGVGGTLGKGGSDKGPGSGKVGLGQGSGRVGRQATQAEIYAMRWRFDLSGSGAGGLQHADKLAAVGFLVAFEAPQGGGLLLVEDLKQRPVKLQPVDRAKYKDAVMWANERPDSVAALSRELQLGFVPPRAIIMAPKELERQMANVEAAYARRFRRPLQAIRMTSFDFRLASGRYEPVVLRQD